MIPPSITVEIFGNMYTVIDFAVVDEYMPTVRSVIACFLLIKSLYTKLRALPSILAQVPYISSSDSGIPNSSSSGPPPVLGYMIPHR